MITKIQLEPEAQAFVDAVAKPPFLHELGPKKGLVAVDQLKSGPVHKLPVDIAELTIQGSPSRSDSIQIMRPQNAPAILPVVVYIHGAGWVFGDVTNHDRLIRELAVRVGVAVVFPNYSLSPEAKYPTAIEESYAVVQWVATHGLEYVFDQERLAMAGDNVGGNMAAAVTLLAKERGGPAIPLQLLFYPVTDASFNTESYHQLAEGYHLRRDSMTWFWSQYTTNPGERNTIIAAPLRASVEQLRGLLPGLVIAAEADNLRDEGAAYANKLRKAGVRVTAVGFLGTIHEFVMLNALVNTVAAREAMTFATAA